jgi:hypothetical protein
MTKKFKVTFSNIYVYDDGDIGAGEITFYIFLNGKIVYKKYKSVSDKSNKVVVLDFSKYIEVSEGEKISIRVLGNESDSWPNGDENCSGVIYHGQSDIGDHSTTCSGSMGYHLNYNISTVS